MVIFIIIVVIMSLIGFVSFIQTVGSIAMVSFTKMIMYVIPLVAIIVLMVVTTLLIKRKKIKFSKQEIKEYHDYKRMIELKDQEKMKQYNAALHEYKNECKRIKEERKEIDAKRILDAENQYNNAYIKYKQYKQEVLQDDTLHNSQKSIELISWLIDRIEHKYANSIKEALLQYESNQRESAKVEFARTLHLLNEESRIEAENREWNHRNQLEREAREQTRILEDIKKKTEK